MKVYLNEYIYPEAVKKLKEKVEVVDSWGFATLFACCEVSWPALRV